jgi:hypothetical protein
MLAIAVVTGAVPLAATVSQAQAARWKKVYSSKSKKDAATMAWKYEKKGYMTKTMYMDGWYMVYAKM